MKITEIQFTNYKAFYGDGNNNKIEIPKGKNLLIYGENGSGKSSIYEGLRNFFLASNPINDNAFLSRHLAANKFENYGEDDTIQIQEDANIKISFNGDEKQVIYGFHTSNVESDIDILEASKTNTFLSYKELLKTYLMEDIKDEYTFQTKLGELIIKDILAQSKNIGTNKPYIDNYNELWVRGRGTRPSSEQKYEIAQNFDIGFKKDIADINIVLGELLNYFFPNLKIELSVIDTSVVFERQYSPIFRIGLKCFHFGIDTSKNGESHLSILNEARLSAIALSIFLAGIIVKSKQNTKIKFLFFDDIFIGLDTSNRIPLLKIFNEHKALIWKEDVNLETGLLENVIQKNEDGSVKYEPKPFFDDYQIFITTYDYNWFETAKNYLPNTKWEKIEMYSHYDDELKFDVPLIISPSLDYYQKAKVYFKKNKDFKDYPAAANYLRKEFEKQYKRILYDKYLLKSNGTGNTNEKNMLSELNQSFQILLKDLGFDINVFGDLETYSSTTLNPLSHDNLSKPIFKRELEEAFILAKKLQSIKKDEIAKGKNVYLKTNKDSVERITSLKLCLDAYKFTIEGIVKFTPLQLTPLSYIESGTTISLEKNQCCSLEKAYDMIHHSVFKVPNASNGKDVINEFYFEDGSCLGSIVEVSPR